MKVKDLKKALEGFDDEMDVMVAVYSGPTDIWTVAEENVQVDKNGGFSYEGASNVYGPFPYVSKHKVVMITGYETE